MKHYNLESKQTEILNRNEAFYAFSQKQFDEQAKQDTEYVQVGHGCVCPKDNCKNLIDELKNSYDEKIKWELENNTKKDIIWYELANHECQITGSFESIVDLMSCYGITVSEIAEEFRPYYDHCVENDYF